MGKFDENPNDNVDYKDYLGDNPSEDLNTQIKEELESMDVIEEDSDSSLNDMGNDELLEQQGFDESYAEDTKTITDINGDSSNDNDDSNYDIDKDYHIFIDGKEVDLSKDPLEGTKMEIGHFEYEDAQLANHLRESEAYNDAIHEAQINAAAKSLGTFTPFAGQAMKNEFDRLHQMEESDSDELERMAEYHHWSHDSYTEEYNP